MDANPPLGVVLHAIGGLASAVFYLPYRKVRDWAWESYWLAGGVFSWIIAPWAIATLAVPNLLTILKLAPLKSVFWSYFFGALWGIGGLSFGLTVRFLGLALGTSMALGYCAAFGTLLPPLFHGQLSGVIQKTSGLIVLAGVGVCMVGIVISGLAGMSKEREMSEKDKKAAISEFSFVKGVWVATFCGIMSACMSYGFDAGKPIAAIAVEHGASNLWKNLPVLIIVLAGGFTTNFIWCLSLNIRNRSTGNYFQTSKPTSPTTASTRELQPAGSAGATEPAPSRLATTAPVMRQKIPLVANYMFCAIAGTTWYLQFFFYGMGTSKMGRFDFSSWTLHMASIIIFGTLVGAYLSEWKGVSVRTRRLMLTGLVVLVASTVIIGYGNYLEKENTTEKTSSSLSGSRTGQPG
jgi:L-rhamnose-H+ transport protein